jgi:hypothetical protein
MAHQEGRKLSAQQEKSFQQTWDKKLGTTDKS